MPKKEDKDKKKHSSKDKDKEKKHSSKDKDKDKDKDKEKKHSSKDKEKEKHSSKDKEKHSSKNKEENKENEKTEQNTTNQPQPQPAQPQQTQAQPQPQQPQIPTSTIKNRVLDDIPEVPSQTNFVIPNNDPLKESIPGFQENFSKVNDAINVHLIPKRQRIIEQMQKIRSKLDEIHAIKEGIIKDIKIEANKYILDTDSQTKHKISDLKTDFTELQSFYEEIQLFISKIGNSHANNEAQTYFLSNCQNGSILNQMKTLLAKPYKDLIFVKTDDIVNKFQELTNSKDEIFELKRIILIKDSIIQSLLQQREIMEEQHSEKVGELTELYNSATRELKNWIDVFEKRKFNQL